MLNIPAQAFPAPGSQQRVAPAGAGGRNKVALKPGHSLMDWIRFAKSGRDLTGLRGRRIEVTEEELQKHNTRSDCWTCIRGMVYNITPYMDYHPGGEDELMRAAGKDGTDLFDQVHRWVNYESMLKECLVGRMATKTITTAKANLPPPAAGLLPPVPVPLTMDKDTRPRYDWFQTDGTVNLVLYTKRKIPSSGCTVVDLEAGVLRVEVLLGKMSYLMHLRLTDEVKQSMAVQTAAAVGKVQISVRKQNKGKWASLGQQLEAHNTFLPQKDRAPHYRDCVLLSKMAVTHNTFLFRLQLPAGAALQVPVGKHVYLKAAVENAEVVRAYTPVDCDLAPPTQATPPQESDLYLMIKVYPDGVFSQHLSCLQAGDRVAVSGPEGPFSLRLLRDVTHLYLLAAGTGLTPMTRLIRLALHELQSIRSVRLLFFNRQQRDILWRHQLEDLAAKDERFEVDFVLSEPCDQWSGRTGRVSLNTLQEVCHRPPGSKCYVCVCGPTAFTQLTAGMMKQLGFAEEELHTFLG